MAESKMAENHLNTKDIAPEEFKAKGLTKAPNFSSKRDYVEIENCPQKELDKATEKFCVEVSNFNS